MRLICEMYVYIMNRREAKRPLETPLSHRAWHCSPPHPRWQAWWEGRTDVGVGGVRRRQVCATEPYHLDMYTYITEPYITWHGALYHRDMYTYITEPCITWYRALWYVQQSLMSRAKKRCILEPFLYRYRYRYGNLNHIPTLTLMYTLPILTHI